MGCGSSSYDDEDASVTDLAKENPKITVTDPPNRRLYKLNGGRVEVLNPKPATIEDTPEPLLNRALKRIVPEDSGFFVRHPIDSARNSANSIESRKSASLSHKSDNILSVPGMVQNDDTNGACQNTLATLELQMNDLSDLKSQPSSSKIMSIRSLTASPSHSIIVPDTSVYEDKDVANSTLSQPISSSILTTVLSENSIIPNNSESTENAARSEIIENVMQENKTLLNKGFSNNLKSESLKEIEENIDINCNIEEVKEKSVISSNNNASHSENGLTLESKVSENTSCSDKKSNDVEKETSNNETSIINTESLDAGEKLPISEAEIIKIHGSKLTHSEDTADVMNSVEIEDDNISSSTIGNYISQNSEDSIAATEICIENQQYIFAEGDLGIKNSDTNINSNEYKISKEKDKDIPEQVENDGTDLTDNQPAPPEHHGADNSALQTDEKILQSETTSDAQLKEDDDHQQSPALQELHRDNSDPEIAETANSDSAEESDSTNGGYRRSGILFTKNSVANSSLESIAGSADTTSGVEGGDAIIGERINEPAIATYGETRISANEKEAEREALSRDTDNSNNTFATDTITLKEEVPTIQSIADEGSRNSKDEESNKNVISNINAENSLSDRKESLELDDDDEHPNRDVSSSKTSMVTQRSARSMAISISDLLSDNDLYLDDIDNSLASSAAATLAFPERSATAKYRFVSVIEKVANSEKSESQVINSLSSEHINTHVNISSTNDDIMKTERGFSKDNVMEDSSKYIEKVKETLPNALETEIYPSKEDESNLLPTFAKTTIDGATLKDIFTEKIPSGNNASGKVDVDVVSNNQEGASTIVQENEEIKMRHNVKFANQEELETFENIESETERNIDSLQIISPIQVTLSQIQEQKSSVIKEISVNNTSSAVSIPGNVMDTISNTIGIQRNDVARTIKVVDSTFATSTNSGDTRDSESGSGDSKNTFDENKRQSVDISSTGAEIINNAMHAANNTDDNKITEMDNNSISSSMINTEHESAEGAKSKKDDVEVEYCGTDPTDLKDTIDISILRGDLAGNALANEINKRRLIHLDEINDYRSDNINILEKGDMDEASPPETREFSMIEQTIFEQYTDEEAEAQSTTLSSKWQLDKKSENTLSIVESEKLIDTSRDDQIKLADKNLQEESIEPSMIGTNKSIQSKHNIEHSDEHFNSKLKNNLSTTKDLGIDKDSNINDFGAIKSAGEDRNSTTFSGGDVFDNTLNIAAEKKVTDDFLTQPESEIISHNTDNVKYVDVNVSAKTETNFGEPKGSKVHESANSSIESCDDKSVEESNTKGSKIANTRLINADDVNRKNEINDLRSQQSSRTGTPLPSRIIDSAKLVLPRPEKIIREVLETL